MRGPLAALLLSLPCAALAAGGGSAPQEGAAVTAITPPARADTLPAEILDRMAERLARLPAGTERKPVEHLPFPSSAPEIVPRFGGGR